MNKHPERITVEDIEKLLGACTNNKNSNRLMISQSLQLGEKGENALLYLEDSVATTTIPFLHIGNNGSVFLG